MHYAPMMAVKLEVFADFTMFAAWRSAAFDNEVARLQRSVSSRSGVLANDPSPYLRETQLAAGDGKNKMYGWAVGELTRCRQQ